jgi:hypothetical protein
MGADEEGTLANNRRAAPLAVQRTSLPRNREEEHTRALPPGNVTAPGNAVEKRQ